MPGSVLHPDWESGVSETSKLPSPTGPKFCWEGRQRKMSTGLSKKGNSVRRHELGEATQERVFHCSLKVKEEVTERPAFQPYVRSSELGKATVCSWHLREAGGALSKEMVFVLKMEGRE